ncbi:MAG: BREX-1 system adenine-specific DNA-methyltransferase PglX, partial [Thiohalocapsa sp.]|uniref:DNA methyltransferase n=1 Tax=Thiohalocapsa sp. TaxID=2497641 RepID=UPI00345C06D0|nr:BREX-1 system adenine-specific DNA-methyltransferase PglX [Thiohalocapsa sp.]
MHALAKHLGRQLENVVVAARETAETFAAGDSLGWVYQFWQTKQKDAVNRSEVKIGADELPAVTQLFTEPYMVAFLLDNSLGAWWAARRLSEQDLRDVETEDELRRKAAIPGVPLEYLRFVRSSAPSLPETVAEREPSSLPSPLGRGAGGGGARPWTPAAGTFDGWPERLAELKVMDPCCGSGHFLVAALQMLVPMRMELEGLTAREAVDAVLRDNLHGLELDRRCVEIAAFALALTAWRWPGAGGWRPLPTLNLACSGLGIHAGKADWLRLGEGDPDLEHALERLYELFKDAPTLESLIDPRRALGQDLLSEKWERVVGVLDAVTKSLPDEDSRELGVTAQGLALSTRLLASRYRLVLTNVPFRKLADHDEKLRGFIEAKHPDAKHDIATAFLERCLAFCRAEGGVS